MKKYSTYSDTSVATCNIRVSFDLFNPVQYTLSLSLKIISAPACKIETKVAQTLFPALTHPTVSDTESSECISHYMYVTVRADSIYCLFCAADPVNETFRPLCMYLPSGRRVGKYHSFIVTSMYS